MTNKPELYYEADLMASRERLTVTEQRVKKEIRKILEEGIADLESRKEDMDWRDWNYQVGIIISGNDAKFILEKLM